MELHTASNIQSVFDTDSEDDENQSPNKKSRPSPKKPRNTPAKPKKTSAKPKKTPVKPKNTPAKPKKAPAKPKKTPAKEIKWVSQSFRPSLSPESHESAAVEELQKKYGGKSPIEIFSLFFDDDLLNEIVQNSITYAGQNNNHSFKLDVADLTKFLGILILSGYHHLPQTDMYWNRSEDCGVQLVQLSMTRDRFREIKKYIHFCDNNNLDPNNKFAKIQPLFDAINKRFLQFGIFSHNLSIDESMVPYFGKHSAKMFMKGKFCD